MKTMEINFNDFGGPVYSGRPSGESIRESKNLDLIDKDNEVIVDVKIPDNAFAVTSSFFLGLFGPSIMHFKTKEAFLAKYQIHARDIIMESLNEYIGFALANKQLFPV